jgi:hypothetical protein
MQEKQLTRFDQSNRPNINQLVQISAVANLTLDRLYRIPHILNGLYGRVIKNNTYTVLVELVVGITHICSPDFLTELDKEIEDIVIITKEKGLTNQ